MKQPAIQFPTFEYEEQAHANGCLYVAGADEAGRGPIAGPVVAAAVILNPNEEGEWLSAIRDSKEMKESEREACYDEICKHAAAYAVEVVSVQEIDEVNILQASLLGMIRSVEKLHVQTHYLLVDGNHYPKTTLSGEAIIKGDQKSLSIAAASILAKVTRDRIMAKLHDEYPQYGWKFHKGYPTKYHRTAVQLFGASPHHRITFNGVKNVHPLVQSPLFKEQYKYVRSIKTKEEAACFADSLLSIRMQCSEEEYFYLNQSAAYIKKDAIANERLHKRSTKKTGDVYETLVEHYMLEKGYQIIARNFHADGGEIDLIAESEQMLVFVEVKARGGKSFGQPHEAVTKSKIKKIMIATEQYLYENPTEKDIRYDVISVYAQKGCEPEITHFEDAFRSDDLF